MGSTANGSCLCVTHQFNLKKGIPFMIYLLYMTLFKLTIESFMYIFSFIPSVLINTNRDSAGNPLGPLMVP